MNTTETHSLVAARATKSAMCAQHTHDLHAVLWRLYIVEKMTQRDMAAYLNVNVKTVYRLAQRGCLRCWARG